MPRSYRQWNCHEENRTGLDHEAPSHPHCLWRSRCAGNVEGFIFNMATWFLEILHLVPGNSPLGPWKFSTWFLEILHLVPGNSPLGSWKFSTWSLEILHLVPGNSPLGPWKFSTWFLEILHLVPGNSLTIPLSTRTQMTIAAISWSRPKVSYSLTNNFWF